MVWMAIAKKNNTEGYRLPEGKYIRTSYSVAVSQRLLNINGGWFYSCYAHEELEVRLRETLRCILRANGYWLGRPVDLMGGHEPLQSVTRSTALIVTSDAQQCGREHMRQNHPKSQCEHSSILALDNDPFPAKVRTPAEDLSQRRFLFVFVRRNLPRSSSGFSVLAQSLRNGLITSMTAIRWICIEMVNPSGTRILPVDTSRWTFVLVSVGNSSIGLRKRRLYGGTTATIRYNRQIH